MTGIMISLTSEATIAPNAAPMMTPTARSTTLPRIANFLNSSSMIRPSVAIGLLRRHPKRTAIKTSKVTGLVDQSGVHHGFAHGDLCLFARRHHRQPQD